jgi:enoyl-CoA hydratase
MGDSQKEVPVRTYDTKVSVQEVRGAVYRIQLARPDQKNALTPELYREIREGILRATGMPEVRVVLLEGQPGSFAVGGDLKHLLDIAKLPAEERILAYAKAYDEPLPFQAILDCPKVVVAKIDGLCLAGGLVIAAVADVAISSDRSIFAVSEGHVGLADPFSSAMLPLTIGLARARYLMMTARRIDALTALAWGIIQEAVSAEDLDAAVNDLIEDLLLVSPQAQTAYKRAANSTVPRMNALSVCDLAFSVNGNEGLAAFGDKRSPQWL